MRLSVQLTRDLDGDFNIAVDDSRNECLLTVPIELQVEAIRLFQALVELVEAVEAKTEEAKS